MKIYTRTGDDGQTGLCTGRRVAKDHPRIEACGSLDELNAGLGLARAEPLPQDIDQLLHEVQHELFSVGASLAMPAAGQVAAFEVAEDSIVRLEQAIDRYQGQLPPLSDFILPGGTRAAAALHMARTVCRRTERRVVTLGGAEDALDPLLSTIRYLNRLGDLLFVLPRVLNARAQVGDETWNHGHQRG